MKAHIIDLLCTLENTSHTELYGVGICIGPTRGGSIYTVFQKSSPL